MKHIKRICIITGVALGGFMVAKYILDKQSGAHVGKDGVSHGHIPTQIDTTTFIAADTVPGPTDAEVDAMLDRLSTHQVHDEQDDERLLNALKEYKKRQAQR